MKFVLDNGHLQTTVSISSLNSLLLYQMPFLWTQSQIPRTLSVANQYGQCLLPSNQPHVNNFETYILRIKELTCLFVQ